MAFPKCCKHCQDYRYCDDRKKCCEFCDYYVNGKCVYKRKRKPMVEEKPGPDYALADYRGDDYGIDDYEEYEIYES